MTQLEPKARVGEILGVPQHIKMRIATLLGDEAIKYQECALASDDRARDGDGHFVSTGRLVIFTPSRVIAVTFNNAPRSGDFDLSTVSTTVECWPRRALTSMSLRDDPDGPWTQPWGKAWPYKAQISLHYADRAETLILPLEHESPEKTRGDLFNLLPSLTADLAA